MAMAITEPSADLPLLMTLEEGEWHTMHMDYGSLEDVDDAGPKGKWNAYSVDLEYGGSQFETEEIPFWAMKAFWAFYQSLSKSERKGEGNLKYRRTETNGKNTAEFK